MAPERFINAWRIQATGNWRDVISDPSLNAIVVGTWPYLHRTLVLEALQAGKHVLTEARLVRQLTSSILPRPVQACTASRDGHTQWPNSAYQRAISRSINR